MLFFFITSILSYPLINPSFHSFPISFFLMLSQFCLPRISFFNDWLIYWLNYSYITWLIAWLTILTPIVITIHNSSILNFMLAIISWWRHQMEAFSALLALSAGNSPVTGEFPAQRPVTRSFDVFFDLPLNKRLRKQSWGWWFETPSRSLWRHCNVLYLSFPGPFIFQSVLSNRLTMRGMVHTFMSPEERHKPQPQLIQWVKEVRQANISQKNLTVTS